MIKKGVVSKACDNLQLSFTTLEIAFPGTVYPNLPLLNPGSAPAW